MKNKHLWEDVLFLGILCIAFSMIVIFYNDTVFDVTSDIIREYDLQVDQNN